ncbi:transmembrane protein 213 [Ctenodactylus gundi]
MAPGARHPRAGPTGPGAPLRAAHSLTSAAPAALLLGLALAGALCPAEAGDGSNSTWAAPAPELGTPEQCPNADFCPQAARCCRAGVDDSGWVAAAVGWSLWFLTLILLCVDKLRKLTPEEPKDPRA